MTQNFGSPASGVLPGQVTLLNVGDAVAGIYDPGMPTVITTGAGTRTLSQEVATFLADEAMNVMALQSGSPVASFTKGLFRVERVGPPAAHGNSVVRITRRALAELAETFNRVEPIALAGTPTAPKRQIGSDFTALTNFSRGGMTQAQAHAMLNSHPLVGRMLTQYHAVQRASHMARAKGAKGPTGLAKIIPQMLSNCCKQYIGALADPFAAGKGVGCCLGPCFPSVKVGVFLRGSFELALNAVTANPNVGWVGFSPWAAITNDGMAPVVYTDANTDRDPWSRAGGAGSAPTVPSNSPLDGAAIDVTGNGRVRLVSAGLRCKYIGTQLNSGGIVVGLCSPTHAPITSLAGATGTALDAVLSYREVDIHRSVPRDQWVTATYAPIYAYETEYLSGSDLFGIATTDMIGMAVIGPGTTADPIGQAYEWEAVCNFEFQGFQLSAVYAPTPGSDDAAGFAASQMITRRFTAQRVSPRKTISDHIYQAGGALLGAASGISHALIQNPERIPIVAAALGAALAGNYQGAAIAAAGALGTSSVPRIEYPDEE